MEYNKKSVSKTYDPLKGVAPALLFFIIQLHSPHIDRLPVQYDSDHNIREYLSVLVS